jgi:hypothetical protein
MALTGSVDQKLMAKTQLNTPQEQSAAASRLNVMRRPGSEDTGGGNTLRQKQISARNNEANSKAKQSAGKSPNKLNQATAYLLKASWLNLIDSFGLTLIYINLHLFGRSIFGDKVFCEMGEEFIPKSLRSSLSSPSVKDKIKKFGLGEKLLLIFLDAFVLIAVLLSFATLLSVIAPYLATLTILFNAINFFKGLFSF